MQKLSAFATVSLVAAATLELKGEQSSILFDNKAKITASCPTQSDACCESPPSPPSVTRMAPKSVYGVPANAKVLLRLSGVALSCVSTFDDEPYALAYDAVDSPGLFCKWKAGKGL